MKQLKIPLLYRLSFYEELCSLLSFVRLFFCCCRFYPWCFFGFFFFFFFFWCCCFCWCCWCPHFFLASMLTNFVEKAFYVRKQETSRSTIQWSKSVILQLISLPPYPPPPPPPSPSPFLCHTSILLGADGSNSGANARFARWLYLLLSTHKPWPRSIFVIIVDFFWGRIHKICLINT